jgi:hypothetical protein
MLISPPLLTFYSKGSTAPVPDPAQKKPVKVQRQMYDNNGEMNKGLQEGYNAWALLFFGSIATSAVLTSLLFPIPPAQAAQGKTYYYVQGDIASEMPSKAICEARLREHFAFDKKIRGAKVYIEDPWPPRCLKCLPPRFFGARKWKSR